MPSGAWRGEVVGATDFAISIKIPRFNPLTIYQAEAEVDVTYQPGDRVLVAFFEGSPDSIEIIRKVRSVQIDVITEVFQETF